MIATITLSPMRFYAFHGCYDTEQKVGNHYTVSLTLSYDAALVAQSDDVGDAVNYLEVYGTVERQMAIISHTLEAVAARILGALKSEYPQIQCAEITVTKLAPPLGGDVGGVSVSMAM